jgi:hypothetical protein
VGDEQIAAAVAEVVQDAADEAVAEVHEAAAVEAAAEAVEDAAEQLEDAAAAHAQAVAQVPDQGDLAELVRTEVRAALAEMQPAGGEVITHEHAVEVAEAAAESAVDEIVEAAQDAADQAELELPGPDDVQLPGDVPEPDEAVRDVADVIDQAASDEAPRRRHWFQRPVIGGK